MSQTKVVGKNKKRQEKLKKELLANTKKNVGRVSAEKLVRDAGYSPNYARSGRLKTTQTWKQILDEVLPESFLAAKHKELITSGYIQHYIFPWIKTKEVTEELEPQANGGKLKRAHKKVEKKKGLTNEEIKAIVESVPGCRLIYIKEDDYMGQVAFFQAPDNKVQRDALDMAYKLRGTFAPEKHAVFATGLENLSDADLDRALSDQSFLINRFKKYDQAKTNDGGNSEPRETGKGARKPSTINKRTAKSRKSVK